MGLVGIEEIKNIRLEACEVKQQIPTLYTQSTSVCFVNNARN